MSKAKGAEELADNVQSDCVNQLQQLLDEQHEQYLKIFQEGTQYIHDMTEMNSRVRSSALKYFESSETAEKFIQNYQELKLNTDIQLSKRKDMHQGVHSTLSTQNEKKKVYESILHEANRYLSIFSSKIKQYKRELEKFEEARCEQIHSSIN